MGVSRLPGQPHKSGDERARQPNLAEKGTFHESVACSRCRGPICVGLPGDECCQALTEDEYFHMAVNVVPFSRTPCGFRMDDLVSCYCVVPSPQSCAKGRLHVFTAWYWDDFWKHFGRTRGGPCFGRSERKDLLGSAHYWRHLEQAVGWRLRSPSCCRNIGDDSFIRLGSSRWSPSPPPPPNFCGIGTRVLSMLVSDEHEDDAAGPEGGGLGSVFYILCAV